MLLLMMSVMLPPREIRAETLTVGLGMYSR